MILTHHSAEPLDLDFARTYDQSGFGNGKPRGLWLSDESDFGWAEWCRREEFNLERLTHTAAFTLAPDANVLTLATAREIRTFSAEYRGHPSLARTGTELAKRYVNWSRVAQRYDGILITPYQWDARYDRETYWYWGWDCASACIWNLSALTTTEATP